MKLLVQIFLFIFFACNLFCQSYTSNYEKQLFMFFSKDVDSSGKQVRLVGYKNIDQEIIIKPRFNYGDLAFDQFGRVLVDGKVGLINRSGEFLIKPVYDDVSIYISDSTVGVKNNGKWGYYNFETNIQSPLLYKGVSCYENGVANVLTFDDKVIEIDKNGKILNELFFQHNAFNHKFNNVLEKFLTQKLSDSTIYNLGKYVSNKPIPTIIITAGFDKDGSSISLYNADNGIIYSNHSNYYIQTEKLIIPGVSLTYFINLFQSFFEDKKYTETTLSDNKLMIQYELCSWSVYEDKDKNIVIIRECNE